MIRNENGILGNKGLKYIFDMLKKVFFCHNKIILSLEQSSKPLSKLTECKKLILWQIIMLSDRIREKQSNKIMTFENLLEHWHMLLAISAFSIKIIKRTSPPLISLPYDQPEVLPVDGELDAEGDSGVDDVEDDGARDLGEDVDHGLPDVASGGEQGGVEDREAEWE